MNSAVVESGSKLLVFRDILVPKDLFKLLLHSHSQRKTISDVRQKFQMTRILIYDLLLQSKQMIRQFPGKFAGIMNRTLWKVGWPVYCF